ncbi:MAG: prolyl oligopeptidase family serine peptidase [Clostridia bacterium]|nr:prolyl oligopeptidase family serine peptidase [Clostridia bacterium]
MEKIINYENLRSFAYSNDKLIKKSIKGIVINFHGLGVSSICNDDPGDAVELAEEGIIYLYPYYNPWCWMNEQAVNYVDEIVDVICDKYSLGDSVKIVSSGGSMGGLGALVYCVYSKRTPTACVANCPVCDLPFHMNERADLPRTLYSAFAHFDGTMEEALRSRSPLHLVERMPDIPYTVFHCCEDKSVNIERHSEAFVKAMSKSHDVEYIRVAHRNHCNLSAMAAVKYRQAILNAFE